MNSIMLHVRRLGVRLTADRRRFAILCMLMAVALLFWTRLIVIKRIPRTALADPNLVLVTEAEVPAEMVAKIVDVVLPERPDRDPFSIDAHAFPLQAGESTTATQHTVLDHEALVAAMRLDASMPPGLAVIDGTTRRRTDTISTSAGLEFTLSEIRQKSVVLERGGHRFVLQME